MKYQIIWQLCFSVLPVMSVAAAFDKHLGDYSVVSMQGAMNYDCPPTDASIRRVNKSGYDLLVLEATGTNKSAPGDCSIRLQFSFSINGAPGISCVESVDEVECSGGLDKFRTTAEILPDGKTSLTFTGSGEHISQSVWILKRK